MRRPRPRRAERRLRGAGFPRQKWLNDFDFDANPAITPAVINTLASCEWVRKGQPLCLIGDSGTGKSHLLIALGTAAAMAGYRVRYTLAAKLANELVEAADDSSSPRPSPATAASTCSVSTYADPATMPRAGSGSCQLRQRDGCGSA
jgi:DNA replication protein DnaC